MEHGAESIAKRDRNWDGYSPFFHKREGARHKKTEEKRML
jgi:hypothetical protein